MHVHTGTHLNTVHMHTIHTHRNTLSLPTHVHMYRVHVHMNALIVIIQITEQKSSPHNSMSLTPPNRTAKSRRVCMRHSFSRVVVAS